MNFREWLILESIRPVAFTHEFVDGMLKDFRLLMRQVNKAKNYSEAIYIHQAFVRYRKQFEILFSREHEDTTGRMLHAFERSVYNKNSKLGPIESRRDHYAYWRDKIGADTWDFIIGLQPPIAFATEYWSKEDRFRKFKEKEPSWRRSINRAAKKAFGVLHEFIDWLEVHEIPLTMQISKDDTLEVAGIPVILKDFDPNDKGTSWRTSHMGTLKRLKAGILHYVERCETVYPPLLQKQLPIVALFSSQIGSGGRYYGDRQSISPDKYKTVKEIAQVLAHEQAHHIYKGLGYKAHNAWGRLLHSDYTSMDIEQLLKIWPEEDRYRDWEKEFKRTNPALYIQYDMMKHGYNRRPELWSRDDFAKVAERGEKLSVPRHPITTYADKNQEEAFCEALSHYVIYGPQFVYPIVRMWLRIILGDELR